jgi:hypothetical protein
MDSSPFPSAGSLSWSVGFKRPLGEVAIAPIASLLLEAFFSAIGSSCPVDRVAAASIAFRRRKLFLLRPSVSDGW